MECLFTQTPLQDLLPSLTFRTSQQQINRWNQQKQCYNTTQKLVRFFSSVKITKAQAKRLVTLKISHDLLRRWKEISKDVEDYIEILKKHKINSKVLRAKLCQFFFR